MYYVRTADKLQRTATWLNGRPGGLEHVREVVTQDTLGIAGELEREMHQVIASYACEWRRTLEDPEKLERFRPFVNTGEADSSIQFEAVRGQPQPL